MKNFDEMPDSAFIRLPQLRELLGLSKSTIYRMIENEDFPKATKLSSRTVAWQVAKVREWLKSKQLTPQAA